MLSISSSGSKHEWGLSEGEADQPDEGPSLLQVGHDVEEDGGENKDRVSYQHMEASQVWGGDQVTKLMFFFPPGKYCLCWVYSFKFHSSFFHFCILESDYVPVFLRVLFGFKSIAHFFGKPGR